MKFQFTKFSLQTWPIRTAATIAVTLMVATVAFLRLPPTARGVVWAEDGGVFLRDAMARQGIGDLFAPYDGYLHVAPRIAAKIVVRFFRVDDYGIAMNFLGCIVIAVVALLVFHCSKTFTPNVYIRLAWASIAVLVAPAPLETLGNFANVHSYFLWLTPWLLLKPSQSRAESFMLFFVATLVSLTEIVAVLFIPLFAIRFKDKAMWPARIGLLFGLAFQAVATLLNPRAHSESYPLNPLSVAVGWFLNSSSAIVYGSSSQIVASIRNYDSWPIVLAAVPFALAMAYILVRGTAEQRRLGIILLLASMAVWGVTQVVNFQQYFDYAAFHAEEWKSFFLSRYSTVPSMFLLALLPLAALCDRSRARRSAVAILAVFAVLQFIYFFPENTARNDGPDWRAGVAAARAACTQDPSMVFASVDVAPANWLKGGLPVQCTVLRSSP